MHAPVGPAAAGGRGDPGARARPRRAGRLDPSRRAPRKSDQPTAEAAAAAAALPAAGRCSGGGCAGRGPGRCQGREARGGCQGCEAGGGEGGRTRRSNRPRWRPVRIGPPTRAARSVFGTSSWQARPLQIIVGLGNPGPEHGSRVTTRASGSWMRSRAAHGAQFRAHASYHGEICRVTHRRARARAAQAA